MIIGTAGHIDHGKTTLVRALTGVDCDRLKEEKARGITLDLGYAYTQTLGFIDVPGHEKLVHNMLAGATGIDFALLLVAADDGPMPQTREHLAIIDLLGIRRGAVAVSKVDCVDDERLRAVQVEIRQMLAGSALAAAPIFPVVAAAGPSGQGVAALHVHLRQAAEETPRSAGAGGFRLAIDRAFTLSGAGTVVTGTAFAGHVAVGDTLMLSPPGVPVRVRSLRAQDREADSGQAGERIALALSGVEKNQIERGMWLLAPTLHAPTRAFDARLRVLPGQPPLKHWTPVHLHLGALDVPARVALLDGAVIQPGDSAPARLLCAREIGALHGDSFILRDDGARQTIAGGQVLDAFPPSRKKRTEARLLQLAALAEADPAVALGLIASQQANGLDLSRYSINRNLDAHALARHAGLTVVGNSAFAGAHWQALQQKLLAVLAEEHARAPDLPGIERERLRRLTQAALSREAFDALLAPLLTDGRVAQHHAWLHLPGHQLALAAADADLWAILKPLLSESPANPPRVRDIARATGLGEDSVRALLKRLARFGEVYPVAYDHYFVASAVARLAHTVAEIAQRDTEVRAATLRDAIGGGRKVAIHLLEFFDRIGYTRRVRDSHRLRGGAGIFGG